MTNTLVHGALPALGWNSWNTFSWKIHEKLIQETADAMISTGLRDAGYEYIVIDDCWSLKERDANGRIAADPEKFPGGMKALADYVHGRGLKFGMYSCAGTHTCAGYPGSFDHEFVDAETFASWGVDYLKYDYCYRPAAANGENLYRRMAIALRNCGRPILLSACNWGQDNVHQWIRGSGASSFRSTGDIQDNWQSIKNIFLSQIDKTCYEGTGCHNDMDMLVVGMRGNAENTYIAGKDSGCSDLEYSSHFSLWAIMNSPLMIGCDIRNMSDETRTILTNPEILAINQDAECRPPFRVGAWNNNTDLVCLWRPLAGGDYAYACVNFGDTPREASLQLFDIGLPYASGKAFQAHNCVTHQDEGLHRERFVCGLESRECKVYRMKLV
jgi:alpha-galactosidase